MVVRTGGSTVCGTTGVNSELPYVRARGAKDETKAWGALTRELLTVVAAMSRRRDSEPGETAKACRETDVILYGPSARRRRKTCYVLRVVRCDEFGMPGVAEVR